MSTQIKDLTEETEVQTGDRFLVQRQSDNKVVTVKNSNIIPPSTIAAGHLYNAYSLNTTSDGIWWRELKRTTLSSSSDTMNPTFGAANYLKIFINLIPTGGTINCTIYFDLDNGANYAYRRSINGAADTTAISVTSIPVDRGAIASEAQLIEIDVKNFAAQEKILTGRVVSAGTAGAANAPNRNEFSAKWANTTDQIANIQVTNSGTGDYASGSSIVILGHD